MLVFANLSGTSWNPEPPKEGISHSQSNSTVVVAPHSTPARDLNLTATAGITQAVTPTEASITICSTAANIVQGRLVICGYNFEAGHKVLLSVFVSGKQFIQRFTSPVDRQGNFQIGWNIVDCGNLPSVIFAYEVVNAKLISARLQNISFGSCPVRAPTSRTN